MKIVRNSRIIIRIFWFLEKEKTVSGSVFFKSDFFPFNRINLLIAKQVAEKVKTTRIIERRVKEIPIFPMSIIRKSTEMMPSPREKTSFSKVEKSLFLDSMASKRK